MIYAIGDVHGLYDPLKVLTNYLYGRAAEGESISRIIFLGDLIDCGPSSKEVVDLVLKLQQDFPTTILMGNHEEMLLSFYRKSFDHMKSGNFWLSYNGGVETVRSFYPASPLFRNGSHPDEKAVADALFLQGILLLEDRYAQFFDNMQLSYRLQIGEGERSLDLLFSHSIPSPRHDLEKQLAIQTWQDLHIFMDAENCALDETLIWNRQLLTKQLSEGLTVIHGHTPTRYYRQMTKLIRLWEEEENAPFVVRERKTRKLAQIDIDTGLIYGGSLTMLAIDDSPAAENPFPYFISIDPKRGLRHRQFVKKELSLL